MIKLAIAGMMPDGITPNLNQLYWFVGDPVLSNDVHSALADENRAISRKVISESGVNFPFVLPHDGKNEQLTFSAKTTRTFTEIVASWRWRNRFSSRIAANWPHPCFGTVIMRFELPDGTYEQVTLPDSYVAKPSMKPDGVSLECGYTVQAGEILDTVEAGRVVRPVANAGAEIMLKLFDAPIAGNITDAITLTTGSVTSLPVGTTINIQGIDNFGSMVDKTFQIVSGGSPAPGNIAIDHPFADNLADIVAAYAAETDMAAELVDDGIRAYVLLKWLPAPAVAANEVRITVTIETGAESYSGTTNAEDYDSLILPVDDAGDIPTANIEI
jgi:hypothetical protein